ncbi:MAG: AAA family ATPase, partial [Deltaproteobacteria bacterium]|nr:AAA family ATPase [Deltaproteobacteria bacterium]
KIRLPENGHSESANIMTLEEAESSHIKSVLKLTGWRIKGEGGAAQLLGMNPSTLYSRMLKLGITSR